MDMTMFWLNNAIKPHPKIQLIRELDFILLKKIIVRLCFILQTRINYGYLALCRVPLGQIHSFYSSLLVYKSRYKKIGDSYLGLCDILADSFSISQFSVSEDLLICEKIKQYEHQIKTQSFDYIIGYEIIATECITQIYLSQLLNQLKLHSLIRQKKIVIDNSVFLNSDFSINVSCPILVRTIINYLTSDDKYYFVTDQKDVDIWLVTKNIFNGYKDSSTFWFSLFDILFDF